MASLDDESTANGSRNCDDAVAEVRRGERFDGVVLGGAMLCSRTAMVWSRDEVRTWSRARGPLRRHGVLRRGGLEEELRHRVDGGTELGIAVIGKGEEDGGSEGGEKSGGAGLL